METYYEQTSMFDKNENTIQQPPRYNSDGRIYRKPYQTRYNYNKSYQRKPYYNDNPDNNVNNIESNFVRNLPNKAFDQEYMTEWAREVKFLHEKGINYVYVKRTRDYGVSQFKYKKTPALFEALKEFYGQVEAEKANIVSPDDVQEMLKGSGISIRKGRNGITFIKDEAKPEASEDVTE